MKKPPLGGLEVKKRPFSGLFIMYLLYYTIISAGLRLRVKAPA